MCSMAGRHCYIVSWRLILTIACIHVHHVASQLAVQRKPCIPSAANLTAPTGVISSPNYGYFNYNEYEECTWTISMPAGSLIQLDIRNLSLVNTTTFRIYDGPEPTYPLLFQKLANIKSYRVTLLSTNNKVHVFMNAGQGSAFGFFISYRAVLPVPSFSFANGNWDVYLTGGRTMEFASGGLRLLNATQGTAVGSMWAKTELTKSDFIVKAVVKFGALSDSNFGTDGLGMFFLENSGVARSTASNVLGQEYGVLWSNFSGTSFFLKPATRSVFAGDNAVVVNCTQVGSIKKQNCSFYTTLRSTFTTTVLFSVTSGNRISGTVYTPMQGWIPAIEPAEPPKAIPYLFHTAISGSTPKVFGMGAMNTADYYDSVDIVSLSFYTASITCGTLNNCNGHGYCVGIEVCECIDLWGGPSCNALTCEPPCLNGGVCLPNNTCACTNPFEGIQCEGMHCRSNRTVTNSTGTIANMNFRGTFSYGNYYSNNDCGWLINLPSGTTIQLDVEVLSLETNADFVEIFEKYGSVKRLIANLTGTTYMRGTFISLSNMTYVRFYSDGQNNYQGFQISYRPIVLQPAYSYVHGGSTSNWDLHGQGVVGGSVRLVANSASQNGAMWANTTLDPADFVVNAVVTIGSTGTSGEGVGMFFVQSNVAQSTPSSPYGIDWANYVGLSVLANANQQSVFATYAKTASSNLTRLQCSSGFSIRNATCGSLSLRNTFNLTVAVAGNAVDVTLCSDTLSPSPCIVPVSRYNRMIPTLTSPVVFGLGAYSSLSNYDYVDVESIQFYTPSITCPYGCSGNGRCLASGNCTCDPNWTGLNCETPYCPPQCQNGGTCIYDYLGSMQVKCVCQPGFSGTTCQNTICLTNTTIMVHLPGTIKSDRYSSHYFNNTRCGWLLQADEGYVLQIWMYVRAMDHDLGDVLEIYDGGNDTENGTLLFRSRSSYYQAQLQSTTNSLFIWFESDDVEYDKTSFFKYGFQIDYQRLSVSAVGTNLIGYIRCMEEGCYNSALGMGCAYYNNQSEGWLVNMPSGNYYWTDVTTKLLDGGGDVVSVYNGANQSASLITATSSSNSKLSYAVTSSSMYVTFVSNANVTGTGWRVDFRQALPLTPCGNPTIINVTEGEGGVFFTQNWQKGYYHHNQTCSWRITVPAGRAIQFNFTVNKMGPPGQTYLRFYDGADSSAQRVFESSASFYRFVATSSSNVAFVELAPGNNQIIGEGFYVDFNDTTPSFPPRFKGTLANVLWPYNNYYPNEDATYLIIAPPGQVIWVDIPNNVRFGTNDYFCIYDGNSTSAPLIKQFERYNNSFPHHQYASSSNYLFAHFYSDSNGDVWTGFNMSWRISQGAEPSLCAPLTTFINNRTGSFKSDHYGVGYYRNNRDCQWSISVPPGNRIWLELSVDAIESNDVLYVYDGANTVTGRLFATHPNGNKGATYLTTGNNAYVRFFSDANYEVRGGWFIRFRQVSSVPYYSWQINQNYTENWNLSVNYIGPYFTDDGSLQLTTASGAQNGALWARTPFNISEFVMTIVADIGCPELGVPNYGLAVSFVPPAQAVRPANADSYPYSLRWDSFTGLSVMANVRQSSIYGIYSRNASAINNYACNGGSQWMTHNGECSPYPELRSTFNVTIAVATNRSELAVTYCPSVNKCDAVFTGRDMLKFDDLMSSAPFMFGLAGHSTTGEYDRVAITAIEFFAPTSDCSPACSSHGVCIDTMCKCQTGWTDTTCSTSTCDEPCRNGGSCTGPNKCTCLTGFGGPICEFSLCQTNSTISISGGNPTGYITSDNYPDNYLDNTRCGWKITSPSGLSVTISVGSIDPTDIFHIYVNGKLIFNSVASYYKMYLYPTSSSLSIYFKSNTNGITGTGFRIDYAFVSGAPPLRMYGWVKSYNYPYGPYFPNQNDYWSISSPTTGKTMIADFSIGLLDNPSTDFAEIRDGPLNTSALIVNSNTNDFRAIYHTTQESIFLRYKCGPFIYNGTGFQLTFREKNNDAPCPTAATRTFTTRDNITSEYWSTAYDRNDNCQWIITGPVGYPIWLQLATEVMELGHDYVSIYDGNTTAAPLLVKTSSSSFFGSFVTSSNVFLVRFTSDSNFQVGNGFYLDYRMSYYVPYYSYDNASYGAWDVFVPYAPPFVQGNGAIRLVKDVSSQNGAMFAKTPTLMSDFVIVMKLKLHDTGTGSRLGVFFVGNETVVRQNAASASFGLDWDKFKGTTFFAYANEGSVFGSTAENGYYTADRTNCHYYDPNRVPTKNFAAACGNYSTGSVSLQQSLVLTFTFVGWEQTSVMACNNANNCVTAIEPTVLPWRIDEFSTPYLMFGIGASNPATSHDIADVESVKVYTTITCPNVNCQNNGSCISSDLCYCLHGWTDAECTTPFCDPSCKHGLCTAPFICTCDAGWTGRDCNVALCDPPCVNSNCSSPDVCQCFAGFTGSECLTPICDPTCNEAGGNCTLPNECTCLPEFGGAQCQLGICHVVCKNGGTCLPGSVCDCISGLWNGSDCSTPICDPSCGYGNCTAPGECTCEPHWANSTGHTCDVCDAGWTGADCETPFCSPACNPIGGNCTKPNVCTCLTGWTGTKCETPICAGGCLHGGTCVLPGNCSCATGWNGTNCGSAICNPPCQKGNCTNPNVCTCKTHWTGTLCDACSTGWETTLTNCATPICDNPVCQNGATCSNPNNCTCSSFWQGAACTTPRCTPSCTHGGTCTQTLPPPHVCTCDEVDWTGAICATPICNPACVNGNCTSPHTCTCSGHWAGAFCDLCASGWNGTNCNIPICDPVCQNGATCTNPNTCQCTSGWTGNLCQTPICSPNCQNGGSCTLPDVCTCDEVSWTGNLCATPICDPTCINGNCTAPDICTCSGHWAGGLCDTCASGWNGTDCNTAICTTLCLNGGACTAPNVCTCVAGWTGSLCQTPICTSACQHGGTCTLPDTCTCDEVSWTGSLVQCATPICNPACVNGNCTAPNSCACVDHWAGSVCGQCATGWSNVSASCLIPVCSNSCQHGGSCVDPDVCSCTASWSGAVCQTPICDPSCDNGGTCSLDLTCNCTSSWQGPTCASPRCTPTCSNGGTCIAPNICSCTPDYTGASCASPVCTSACQHGGTCSAPETCTCTSSWTGPICAIPVCTPSCQNSGTCTAPDVCGCTVQYTGSDCTTPVCNPICENGGTCVSPDNCTCTSSWQDATCITPVCQVPCQHGGTCSAPDICTCTSYYNGPFCEAAICNPACQNGATCSTPNNCTCAYGWEDVACDLPICVNPCQNGGTCTYPDTCACDGVSWTGQYSQCTTPICNPSCALHGRCTLPNECTCDEHWNGTLCELPVCDLPCLNNGTCAFPNTCACPYGWKGIQCESNETLTFEDMMAMTNAALLANLPPIEITVREEAAKVAKNPTPEAAGDFLETLDMLLNRYTEVYSNMSDMTAEQFAEICNVCAMSADAIMMAATNKLNSESGATANDTSLDYDSDMRNLKEEAMNLDDANMKCKVLPDGTLTAEVTDVPPPSGFTAEKLRKLFNSFMLMLVNMFANLRTILRPGMNMTFNGQFYGATVFNIRLGDVPNLLLDTSLASAKFPNVEDPLQLIGTLPTQCKPLNVNSTIPTVMSSFIVNVMDVDKPFNMPTIAVRMYCVEKADLPLNPALSIIVTGKPSVKKAQVFASRKTASQCDVSKFQCDLSENADAVGSLANFPLTVGAGDFVLIFPVITFNYSAYISFNTTPSAVRFQWMANVTTKGAVNFGVGQGSLAAPRFYFRNNADFRIIIPRQEVSRFAYSNGYNDKDDYALYVYLKRDFSYFDLSNLPSEACDLQRVYGYHLRIGLAAEQSKFSETRRKRDTIDASSLDGFQLEAESSESAVVFKSQYFGDFGADLVVAPNSIEFSNIFANFATLVANNAGVLAFQVSAVVFFLVGIVFAWRLDRDDLKEWAFLPIISNTREQLVKYLISVHFNKVKNFHLDPKISICLDGTVYDTTWRLLEDGIRKKIWNGKHPANYTLTTQLPLGRIDAVELDVQSRLQDPTGLKHFQLHIDRVVIVDVTRGLKYVYLVKKTFRAGERKRTELATEDEMKGYTYLITGQTRTSFTDVHPWLSIAQRPLPSNWTRVERLACVVSALFMAMMVNAMFYGQEAKAPKVGLRIGNFFTISWFTVWTSFIACVIVIPPTGIMAFIFKKIKRRTAERSEWVTVFNMKVETRPSKQEPQAGEDKMPNKKEKKPLQLPFYCVIIAWFLVAASVGVSSFFIVMYSLSWGQEKSLQWLSGMLLSIFQDILLIQPIKVVLSAIVSATVHSLPDDGLEMGKLTYNPNNNRRKVELFKKARNLLAGIFHHAIYVVLFATVIGTTTNQYAYTQIQVLKETFAITDTHQVSGTVTDYSAMFKWLEGTLVPALLIGNQLEKGGVFKTPTTLYSIPNPQVVILGPVRLRQQRVSQVPCVVATSTDLLNYAGRFSNRLSFGEAGAATSLPCQMPYSNGIGVGTSSERRSFNRTWKILASPNDFYKSINLTFFDQPWVYRDTESMSYSGWEASYGTSGYWVDLPRTFSNAKAIVNYLRLSRWLDNATTTLLVDFNLFNMQTNLFIPVKVAFEALSAGGMSYHVRMFPLQLYQYSGAASMLIFVVQAFWILLLLSHLVRIIRLLKREGVRKYWSNGWDILDTVQVILGLAIVGLFVFRIYIIMNHVEKIHNNRTKFISLESLASFEDIMFCLFGIQFFMAMFLFFRHLSINKHWAVLLATLSKGKLDLAAYGFIFATATFLFSGIAYLVMGHDYWDFSSYSRSILAFIQSIIGTLNFELINTRFSLFLCMMYTAIVVFLGTNMFVTLIMAAYGDVVTNVEETTNWDAELAGFLATGIKELIIRKKPGEDLKQAEEEFQPIGDGQCANLEQVVHRFDKYVDRHMEDQQQDKNERCNLLWMIDQMKHIETAKLDVKLHGAARRPSAFSKKWSSPSLKFLSNLNIEAKKRASSNPNAFDYTILLGKQEKTAKVSTPELVRKSYMEGQVIKREELTAEEATGEIQD